MTNELAIRILTGDVLGTSEQTQEAVTMAVRALSQPSVTDTISRQAAIDFLTLNVGWKDEEGRSVEDWDERKEIWADLISLIPSAQLERKKGRWIYHINDLFPAESTQECSVCHEYERMTLCHESYCPNCGALMDVEDLSSAQQWIPCSERLPNYDEYTKNNGLFIVSDGNRSYSE